MRTSPPSLFTRHRALLLPGTRSMSPKEQKITLGREAIASALSITSSGVTHTGQPGPWISSISSGSNWSMPLRMMEWVWPPQTSMMAHGRVTILRISEAMRWAMAPSRNSFTYFIGRPLVFSQFLVEHAELLKQLQALAGGFLVDPVQREADMHDGVLAHLNIGDVLEADGLGDAAEVHLAHQGSVVFEDLTHAAGNRQAHRASPKGPAYLMACGWCARRRR